VEPERPIGQSPAGWHRDPTGRFEYRYFNGVQWTSDVSVNGHRYVDSPIGQIMPRWPGPRIPRGKAIASFVTAASAVAVGWVPFVFVLAAAAAIVAIVFGVAGLKTARQHNGYGRSFAVAGLVLAPVALAVCVGGFFFTKAVVRELREYVEPGPHKLTVDQPCTLDQGRVTLTGSIRNLDDRTHDYRIVVDFTAAGEQVASDTVAVADVAADQTAPWSSSVELDETSVDCKVTDVFGPPPFDFEQD
jgi:uncharacterized protein DUF2510